MAQKIQQVLDRLEKISSSGDGWSARCPSHDDRDPSLSVSEGEDGRVLLYCHAGCTLGEIVSALNLSLADLFPGETGGGGPDGPQATYFYADEKGAPYYVIHRFPEKEFRARRLPHPSNDLEAGEWGLADCRRVLYGLRHVERAVEDGDPIWVVEGEKDAKNLNRAFRALGRDDRATTNAFGAGSWKTEYTNQLVGAAEVVVVADRDSQGYEHASEVRDALKDVVESVEVVRTPVGEKGADATDHLEAGHDLDEFEEFDPEDEIPDAGEDPAGGDDGEKPPQKVRIVQLALSRANLFTDERDRPFANLEINGHRETWPVSSTQFKRWVSRRFWEIEGEVPASSTMADALNVVEAEADFEGPERRLHNRMARHEGAIWYDLADDEWRAIRIDPEGWSIVADPPPLFRRYSHQQPQVEPVRDGDLDELDGFLNLGTTDDEILVKVWLVAALLPDVPRAILVPWGEQGSGKSVATKMLRRLLDPSATPTPRFPRGDAEMAQALDHHGVVAFDNLSSLSPRHSDTLCRAVTGEGFTKRELYTDQEDVLFAFRRAVILNGINVPAQRPDLLDRCVLIELDRIPKEERTEERKLWEQFESARPRFFGAMLTALSRAMQIEPEVELEVLPRMADWARWGYAIAEALEIGGDRFLRAYYADERARHEEALESHPLGAAVLAFMDGRETYSGIPTNLLDHLRTTADDAGIDTEAKLFPGSANWLRRRLNEVETNLREAGIEVGGDRDSDRREIVLRKTGTGAAQ